MRVATVTVYFGGHYMAYNRTASAVLSCASAVRYYYTEMRAVRTHCKTAARTDYVLCGIVACCVLYVYVKYVLFLYQTPEV